MPIEFSRSRVGRYGVWLAVGMMALQGPLDALACAPAPPPNKPVQIASESAIIIWDAKAKTQHFIRRATFVSSAEDFGFLVPTPTQPVLNEADDKAFDVLAEITAPRIITKPRPSPGCGIGCAAAQDTAGNKSADVTVLEASQVAGYDYAVLKTEEADALSDWLQKNGYPYSPQLMAWAEPYLEQGWVITAFKISVDNATEENKKSGQGVGTSAVRMTFQTEAPFFPYREPEEQSTDPAEQISADVPSENSPENKTTQSQEPQETPESYNGPRLLRVFFLSTERMQGKMGETDEAWPGKTVWANSLSDEQREKVLDQLNLPKDTAPTNWWLTEFEDDSSPRPGKVDVYFSPATDQNTVEREPHIRYTKTSGTDYSLFCCLIGTILIGGAFSRSERRRRNLRG